MTDGVGNAFVNNHIRFTSWGSEFSPFLMIGSSFVGLYAEFSGGGRIVLTGPDQDFHAWKFGGGASANQYILLVNELLWVSGQQ